MPENKRRKKGSAAKALRRSQRARLRNLAVKSRIKTAESKTRTAIRASDPEIAGPLGRESRRLMDKAVSKGILHKRAAARRKSRLSRRVAQVSPPAPSAVEEAS